MRKDVDKFIVAARLRENVRVPLLKGELDKAIIAAKAQYPNQINLDNNDKTEITKALTNADPKTIENIATEIVRSRKMNS